ncbi:cyclin-dependent kinase inhibitor 2-like [Ipomoea triloba]|uniref:cyclin-dependent kinase inhibitor 2-like n=1 Tax=Ipomoea triloba TaxID=35885 RepID=UPI00125CD84B|nr:cyclin-dependent kinase inhibitor 2-like [Ipomoea triloba]
MYLRMSNGAEEEVAVMEVAAEIGVKMMKRGREVVDGGEETDVVKRMKIGLGEGELKPSSPAAPSLVQLVMPVNSVAPPERLDHAPASCCIINQSSELGLENLEFVDLQEEGDGFATPKHNSESEESGKVPPFPAKLVPPKQLKFRLISKLIPNNYPLAEEVEEFFAAAEEQKRLQEFSDKYNFDFENEKPMEGRYEWVKLFEEPAMKVGEDSADEITVASSTMKIDEDSGDEVSPASQ